MNRISNNGRAISQPAANKLNNGKTQIQKKRPAKSATAILCRR
jgi:hypothetical protein